MEKLPKEGWKGFIDLCKSTDNDKILAEIFELMFTPEEKQDFSMRYLIIKELLQGDKTQREISSHLNVSIAKITRGSNEIKRMKVPLIQYLKNTLTK